MAILWLGFMGLFLMALGYPLAQRFSYYNRRSGAVLTILEGYAAFLLEVSLFTIVMAAAGYVFFGTTGAVVLGLVGMAVSFLLGSVLGTFSAAHEL